MPKVEFLFDFGSLNAYLAHKVMPQIEARTGAKFEYVPILLGGVFKLTNNKPPMVAFGGIKGKMEYERLEIDRFVKRHAITAYRFNPYFPVNTLAIMRGAVAAEMAGELAPYTDAMFHHLWEAEKKLDEPDVIRASLIESGLDADRLMEAAQSPEVKQRLLNNTEAAVARGTFGSPTFFVNGEIFFGKDRLRDVEKEIGRPAQS